MLMISYILVLFILAFDVSNAAGSTSGYGIDGLWPFAPKHVVIHNVLAKRQTLNVHCKSSDNDLGLIHIPWNGTWGLRFKVNVSKTTKFRCHFTWNVGESHEFNIFEVSRDDTPFGYYDACRECIWEVRSDLDNPICRIYRDKSEPPLCFPWDDIL